MHEASKIDEVKPVFPFLGYQRGAASGGHFRGTDVPGQDLEGERCWMRFTGGRTVNYPADPGVVHRILDFEIEMIREQYLTP